MTILVPQFEMHQLVLLAAVLGAPVGELVAMQKSGDSTLAPDIIAGVDRTGIEINEFSPIGWLFCSWNLTAFDIMAGIEGSSELRQIFCCA